MALISAKALLGEKWSYCWGHAVEGVQPQRKRSKFLPLYLYQIKMD